jgi:cytochrome c peroxidase
MPSRDFQDGRKLAHGIGTTTRRTMSLVGAAWQTWFFWDGRKDSLWSQALGPLENPLEHGLTRAEIVRVVKERYGKEYESVFGPMRSVDRAFANVGKAIAAYETRISLEPARFDRYVAAAEAGAERGMRDAMSAQEEEGLAFFVGKAGCIGCHSGPFFTNGEFHNTGVPPSPAVGVDEGRFAGLAKLRADEFNCLGRFSDAKPDSCAVQFLPLPRDTQRGAFKPPGLRNVTRAAPYMHAGLFASLAEVLRHYNRAPRAAVGHSELHPLGLADGQLRAIEAFLGTLESPVRAP